ncbi:hypothetical protein [Citrobacter werkmanii]|uniref:hypothetical protein n=1 Tax=Citrobacter werkmanii TaxID=67827 RepID=UPI00300D68C2
MVVTILGEQSNVVEIIPAYFSDAEAIAAAEAAVREAALAGKTFTAVDEDGENALPPEFQMLIEFIPHGRRIASNLMDRMARNPAELHMLLSGSPKIADLITAAITEYFEKQIAIGKEYLAMPEHKRQRVREYLFNMIAPTAA